jgi:hypothetical protein
MPPKEGNEVMCSKTPEERWKRMATLSPATVDFEQKQSGRLP